jgi:hypothetical protein
MYLEKPVQDPKELMTAISGRIMEIEKRIQECHQGILLSLLSSPHSIINRLLIHGSRAYWFYMHFL